MKQFQNRSGANINWKTQFVRCIAASSGNKPVHNRYRDATCPNNNPTRTNSNWITQFVRRIAASSGNKPAHNRFRDATWDNTHPTRINTKLAVKQ